MRSSDNYLLGVKALVYMSRYSPDQVVFSSPSISFRWLSSGYVVADCARNSAHVPPFSGCQCGIYATNTVSILDRYMRNRNAVAVLVAACGETEVWSGGWRAQAAQVVGVVGGWRSLDMHGDDIKMYINRDAQLSMIAATYFGVDVLSMGVALEMVNSSWLLDGYVKVGDGGGYDKEEKVWVSKAG